MKPITAIIAVMTAAGLAFAQLLPPKTDESVKIDRALIFKVDYGDETAMPDSSSEKKEPAVVVEKKKGSFAKNTLIWTGLCITGAALSAAFGGHGPINCDPDPPPTVLPSSNF